MLDRTPLDNIKINKEKITTESAKIQKLIMYEVGEDRDGDKTFIVDFNNVNKIIKELSIIKIDDNDKKNIMDELKPIYSKNKDFIIKLFGKDLDDELGYKINTNDFNSNKYPNSKSIIFATPAGWYSKKAQIIRHNLLNMVIPVLTKYLKIDYLVEGLNGGDFYVFLMNNYGIVYNLVFDITHDDDSFELKVTNWDLVDSLEYEIGSKIKKVEFDITDKLKWHLVDGDNNREKEVFIFWKNRMELLKNNNFLNFIGIESYNEDYKDISKSYGIIFHENLLNTRGKVFFKIHNNELEKACSGKSKGLYYDIENYTKIFNILVKKF